MNLDLLLLMAAFICFFLLSAFSVNSGRVQLQGVGLALWTLSLLI